MPTRLDPSRRAAAALRVVTAFVVLAPVLAAQESAPRTRYVLSIGTHPRVDGVRINFRDRDLDLVRGANVTLWQPYDGEWTGTVRGFAVGLPSTGAARIEGIGVGIIGISASEELRGLALGGIGVGSGGDIRGIALGGIGAGAGGDVRGAAIGLIGVGAGGDVRGIAIGGIGAGAGGNVRGITIGGIGVGAGGNFTGFGFGGVGVGAGGNVRGVVVGGVGVGAGGDVRGLAVGIVGVGAGGTIRGLAAGGVGVGAPRIEGIAIGSMVGAEELVGFAFAPGFFRTDAGGRVSGVTLSSVTLIRGDVHGLSLGIVNYAYSMRGAQIGVLNIIRDNPRGRRVLPIVNWGDR